MLVVDASVAVKFAVEENDSDLAYRLAVSDEEFIAPSLIWAEVASTLWKKARLGEISASTAETALSSLSNVIAESVPTEYLRDAALRIAIGLGHPVYDCFYLSLAEQRDVRLITADKRLFRVTRGTRFERHVFALGQI